MTSFQSSEESDDLGSSVQPQKEMVETHVPERKVDESLPDTTKAVTSSRRLIINNRCVLVGQTPKAMVLR